LTEHIFGVDIDFQAVEVTKLSLLLKALEGLQEQEVQRQLFHERILPNLGKNVKCGNSLIGTDFYAQGTLNFSEDEMLRINCFDWKNEFSSVFGDGGFDAVIGNPPYVQIKNLDETSQQYLTNNFSVAIDLYSLFIEQSLKFLKNNNTLGYIVPSLFLKGVKYEKLRNLINNQCNNALIKEYGDNVFQKVKMPTCIILLSKGANIDKRNFFENSSINFFNKVETVKLDDISNITRGLEIGRNKLLATGKCICLKGGNIDVYCQKGAEFIDSKTENEFGKNIDIFKSPKIMFRETGNRFYATIDYENALTTRSIYNIRIINENYKSEYILGIINSYLFRFYFKQFIAPDTNIFPKIRIAQLREIPFPSLDLSQKSDKDKHDKLVSYVEQMLHLKKKEQTEKLPPAKSIILRQINTLEKQIDCLVYELYGLTEEEIRIVEGG
jgi:type I restriction-modification system DNA methylase subunit